VFVDNSAIKKQPTNNARPISHINATEKLMKKLTARKTNDRIKKIKRGGRKRIIPKRS
jgi:hypothetical protein